MPMIHDPCIYQPVYLSWNLPFVFVLDGFYLKFSLLSSFYRVVESSMSPEKVDSNFKSATP